MSIEEKKVDSAPETPAEEEYRKPNPEDNPRNIALREIAATVAKQHEVSASETAPSIDDEGKVTPAPSAEPPPETPAGAIAPPEAQAEAPLSSEAAPVELASAAQDAIDPAKEYEVIVDGQKMKVPGKAIIDAGYRTFQKETAADFRLKMASELLREAEGKVRAATPQSAAPEPKPTEPTAKTDAELANALQFGTPEQAAEAMSVLRGRGTASPEEIQKFATSQARLAAQDEVQFQDAMKFVQGEYADLLSNDYLKRLFFVEENRRRAPKERGGEGDRRPYRDLYKSIGDDLRKSFNLTKAAPAGQPTPPGTAAARQARKAETPPVPRTAAARLQESAAAEKAKTPSEIIAGMAAMRGKAQLSTTRKGT